MSVFMFISLFRYIMCYWILTTTRHLGMLTITRYLGISYITTRHLGMLIISIYYLLGLLCIL